MLLWNPLAKVSNSYMASGTQMRSDGLNKKIGFPLPYGFFFVSFLFLFCSVLTCKSGRFGPIFFPKKKKKVVPQLRMSRWPHNGSTVTARPWRGSDTGRMPLWEGSTALYSLRAEVLTPCVGPLTPHLPSPLMWLY